MKEKQWEKLASLLEQYTPDDKEDSNDIKLWLDAMPDEFKYHNEYLLWLDVSLSPSSIKQASNYYTYCFNKNYDAKKYQEAFVDWTNYAKLKFYYLDRYSSVKNWLSQADKLLNCSPLPKDADKRAEFSVAYFNALLFVKPDKKLLIKWAKKISEELLHCKTSHIKTNIYNHLILYNIWVGNMHEARLLHKESLGIIQLDAQKPFNVLMQSTMFAMVNWLSLHTDQATDDIKRGLEFGSKIGVTIWHAQMLAQLVYAHICSGEFTKARKYLTQMEKHKDNAQLLDNTQYHYLLGWLHLSEEKFPEAQKHLLRALELSLEAGVFFPEAVIRICLAQAYFSQNNLLESVKQLAKTQWIGHRMGSKHLRYGGLLAQSWVMHQWGNSRLSSHYLKKAMLIAATEGYIIIPGWPHKVMQPLLEKALHENIQTAHVQLLISKHRVKPTGNYPNHPDWPWHVTIKCLSNLEISIQGEIQNPKGKAQKKPIELIQLLTFYPKGIAKYKICDYLYPDDDADKAMQALDTTIFRTRKFLKDKQAIISSNGSFYLNPKLCHSNVMELNFLIHQNIENFSSEQILQEFKKLRALCGNSASPIDEEQKLAWLDAEHQSMKARVIKYLNQCVKHVSTKQSIEIYHYILKLDATLESSYQNLIIAYQKLDQQIDAHKVWLQCEKEFKRIYGLSPSSKTKKLIENKKYY